MPHRAPASVRHPGGWLAPWLALGVIAAFVAFLAWPVLQARRERAPVYYEGLPFTVTTPVVEPGEAVEFAGERCNRTRKPLMFVGTRSLVRADGPQYPIPPSVNEAPPGCVPFTAGSVVIPAGVAPGRYRLAGVVTVAGTSGRSFAVGWSTEWFEVR